MKYKETILEIIKKYVPECKVYLFGSRARKSHTPGSDIDLAVDAGKEISRHVISSIIEAIEEKNVPFFVDVVDLYSANDQLKKEVEKDGVLWSE